VRPEAPQTIHEAPRIPARPWLREFCASTEIDDLEAFREQGLARLRAPDEAVAVAREVRDPPQHPFSTPSGKIEVDSTGIAVNPSMCGLGAIPCGDDPRPCRWSRASSARARTRSTTNTRSSRMLTGRTYGSILDDTAARGIADGAKVRVLDVNYM